MCTKNYTVFLKIIVIRTTELEEFIRILHGIFKDCEELLYATIYEKSVKKYFQKNFPREEMPNLKNARDENFRINPQSYAEIQTLFTYSSNNFRATIKKKKKKKKNFQIHRTYSCEIFQKFENIFTA